MSTRRDFLASTLAFTTVSLAAGAGANEFAPKVRIVTEPVCSDTLHFARYFGVKRNHTSKDPGEFIFALEDELRGGGVRFVYGLTRASTQFLVEQILAPHNYQICYRGRHRYVNKGVEHVLEGSAGPIDSVTAGMKNTEQPWPLELAEGVDVLRDSIDLKQQSAFWVTTGVPQNISGHLTSWLLRCVG
ncbi:MAG TPA: hypothetical protein DGR97_10975 [Gammaproteobacteria bacterium]|nr:hypothetical protein [Gammaproteobacteria bacterium]|tara:strand:- start:708 stop:1271 length:564 start_codon:yes stop_codon:yes gene_type:complete